MDKEGFTNFYDTISGDDILIRRPLVLDGYHPNAGTIVWHMLLFIFLYLFSFLLI